MFVPKHDLGLGGLIEWNVEESLRSHKYERSLF
jgi:hypothetical protein